MKVSELIAKLQEFPPDAKVTIYNDLEEGMGMAYSVGLLTPEDVPYCKGDNVYDMGDLEEDEEAVIIYG